MPTQDRQMAWMRKKKLYSLHDMAGLYDDGTSGVPQGLITTGVTEALPSTTVVPVMYHITVGEFVGGRIPVPYDLDPRHSIGFRVHYSGDPNASAAGTNTWLLLWKKIIEGAAYATAATALDTVIAADPYGANTDFFNKVSPRGILLPTSHQLTRDQIEDGAKIMIKLELDVTTNMSNVWFDRLEMDYVPQLCWGPGSESDAPLKSTGNNA